MNSTIFGVLRGAVSAVFLLAACNTTPESQKAAPDGARPSMLSGEYTLVARRRAGDVVGSVIDPTFSSVVIGETVSFDKTVIWFNENTCANWSEAVNETPSANLNDPNLADLIISPDGGLLSSDDQSKLSNIQILCDGVSLAVVTRIDGRVLVTSSPSGLTYAILERPLSSGEIRDLQLKLKELNFYDEEATGEMDEATINSVSRYASYRGRYDVIFRRSALTENLLKGLGVLTSDKVD